MREKEKKRVIIVGGGFGGLTAAQSLGRALVSVTVLDTKNHHTFQPLLYQVATAGLSPGEIAAPIRWVLRRNRNTEVLLAQVTGFDLPRRTVRCGSQEFTYDYLIVAAGASHAYFGHDEWEPYAPGLKTIEDALEIRRRMLLAFEIAERQAITGGTHEIVSFVVVGGGPTGVELAGTLSEISRKALARDFRAIDPKRTRILLLEGGPRILPTYPADLSRSAQKQLEDLGVEVHTSEMVTGIEPSVVLTKEKRIPASVILWAAGVAASPLGRALGVPTDRAGRVFVQPDLSLPDHPEVFVIGDLAALRDQHGNMLPGVAPVAIQEGKAAAKTIVRDLHGEPRRPFHYFDKGSLATIGRSAAVAQIGRVHISGLIAWLTWLFVHIMYLIGFRNRVLVLIQWAWSYFTYDRGARLITGAAGVPGWEDSGFPAKRAEVAAVDERRS